MRIALVSPYDFAYPGGVNNHVTHLSRNFDRMGHDVTILAPSSKTAEQLDVPELEVVGKRPVPVPSGGSSARITLSPLLSGHIKRILGEKQFDVVHLHEPLLPALPLTVLRHSTATNIGTFHAYHESSLAYHYSRRILMRYFRRLHGKIAVSPPAMEFNRQYFPGYYNIIPNGVDLEHFSPAQPPLAEYMDGKLNILFVGRPEKRKGLQHLLGAFSRVRAKLPETRLMVVGPKGRSSWEYEALVDSYDLKDVVFIRGVSYSVLPRYYTTAHVFCAPNTGQESQGVILLEALASGRPIVASNIPGFAYVMAHGEEGLMAPPGDEDALAEALVILLQDEGLRQRMGARGWLRAQDFSWQKVSRRILDYYSRLLQERSRAETRL